VNELWIITAFVFAAALFAVPAIYWLVFETRNVQRSMNRRLVRGSERPPRPDEMSSTLRRERGVVDTELPALRRLNDFLTQTGLRLDRNLIVLSVVGLAAVLFFAGGLVFGYGMTLLLVAVLSALLLTYGFFRTVRERRIARFAEQLPDAVDIIARGIRVGYPVPVALDLVAREMPDPIGTEFGMTLDEIAFGQDIKTAVENLHRRVGLEDLQFLVVAINVQNQTGGNLAEILSRLSRLMRSRAKIQLKIRALSAEGRISAKFLSLMPFILFGIIALVSPAYFAEVRHHPAVEPALIYGAISLLLGNVVMYRMVNFKF
jgi:tight adherence protein B